MREKKTVCVLDAFYNITTLGTHFRYILNFLRDGVLPSDIPKEVIGALKLEAAYYQLQSLTTALSKYK